MEKRVAQVHRKTGETDISMQFCLDGSGKAELSTGIGFFDHMMDAFTRHGLFDMTLKAEGDLHVDGHHTVEDTGIVLGQAIREAVGDKKGIKRYGFFVLPMDEALLRLLQRCHEPAFQDPFGNQCAPHYRGHVQVLLQGAGYGDAEGGSHHGRTQHEGQPLICRP